jgi:acyl dehydratase
LNRQEISRLLEPELEVHAPVFIGDTITAEAEVASVHAVKPVTQLKIKITRQTGETVLEGEAWCYTFSPE